MEFILHYMYMVAIKDAKAWYGDTVAELSMIGFWNLIIVWLKVSTAIPHLANALTVWTSFLYRGGSSVCGPYSMVSTHRRTWSVVWLTITPLWVSGEAGTVVTICGSSGKCWSHKFSDRSSHIYQIHLHSSRRNDKQYRQYCASLFLRSLMAWSILYPTGVGMARQSLHSPRNRCSILVTVL